MDNSQIQVLLLELTAAICPTLLGRFQVEQLDLFQAVFLDSAHRLVAANLAWIIAERKLMLWEDR